MSVLNSESPILAIGFLIWIAGYSVVHVATAMPDPGHPSFPSILATLGAFVGVAFHIARHRAVEGVQLTAFMFAFVATGIGLTAYIACLIAAGF